MTPSWFSQLNYNSNILPQATSQSQLNNISISLSLYRNESIIIIIIVFMWEVITFKHKTWAKHYKHHDSCNRNNR